MQTNFKTAAVEAALTSGYECLVRPIEGQAKFIAEYTDVPTVVGYGNTRAEAVSEAERRLCVWVKQAKSLGFEIPLPSSMPPATGSFKVRAPKKLHRDLSLIARSHNCSLTQLTTRLLASGIGEALLPDVFSDAAILCAGLPAFARSKRHDVASDQDFSGVWLQRVPRIVHSQLKRLALIEGTSMATIVVYILSMECGKIQQYMGLIAAETNRSNAA